MNNLTCNMCGSPDVKREGNYYVCNSCGTKKVINQDNDSSENNAIKLTAKEKAELNNLKANLEKGEDMIAERVLELEPNNWLAYRILYDANNRWFTLLRDSGMTKQEIEKALTVHYYEDEKELLIEKKEYYYYKYFSKDDDYNRTIKEFKNKLNSDCSNILSILGDEYSELTKSWQKDADKLIDEFNKERQEKQKRGEKKVRNRKITAIFATIVMIGGGLSLWFGLDTFNVFLIVLGAIGLAGGFVLYGIAGAI